MLAWTIKSMWQQKVSLVTGSAGVAVAFLLVLIMDAAFVGESRQIVAYIENTKADVWVMQKGVSNMHMATTFVRDWKVKAVGKVPGVKRVTAILYVNTVVKTGGRNWFAYVMGLTPNGGRAGPWSMAQGKALPGPGEIVLPQVLAQTAGLTLGDTAAIADQSFRIVGLSNNTFSMANSIAFVSFADLEQLVDSGTTVSFILVDAEPGQDPQQLARRIEGAVDKVSAVSHKQFIKNDFQIAVLMGVEVVSFMTVISTMLAGLIVAFSVYSHVTRNRRELAILKTLGFANSTLYGAVIFQTVVMTCLAMMLALVFTAILVPVLTGLLPIISLEVTVSAIFQTVFIAFFVSIVAALLPTWFVAKVDPITAFKV